MSDLKVVVKPSGAKVVISEVRSHRSYDRYRERPSQVETL